jgi:hypothetical protein
MRGARVVVDVLLVGVYEVRVERDGEQWDYSEITEVHVADTPAGVEVEVVLWNEPNALVVKCQSASLVQRP